VPVPVVPPPRVEAMRQADWPTMVRYVIRGGQPGYDRLLLLARDRGPDTSALLERAGVGPGMRCVDLGCGGGEVTLELARLVAPAGEVVGVDLDETTLGLAREAAARRHVANAEFRGADVNEWDEPDAYDAVYARFLLHHLSEPVALLARMWRAVRPGGVLIVEDADFDGWCAHPPNDGFDFFVRAYRETLATRGGDHTAGRKLASYFHACGIPRPEVRVVQPAWLDEDEKALPVTTLEAIGDAAIAEQVASAAEVATAVADLAECTRDPTTLLSGPRIFQVWSKRPAAS
jgi:ubiquinone/menaquinone biosynthesis C-methylase UbiE